MTTELSFIASLRALATHPAARGLADDAAVLAVGGETLVLTHDTMVEGVHFVTAQDPADVAWKLVASNMSDLAAKGAEPIGVLLAYQLGQDEARFVEGLGEALALYGAALLGGDTVAGAGPRSFGLSAIGRATHCPVPSRAGARVGDQLWLTGSLGAAMAGFEALRSGSGDSTAYRRPRALLAEGRTLAPLVTAMMDVSDGLLLDAARMARASGVTVAIDAGAIPLAVPEQRRAEALRWGEDYQLLFTLPDGVASPVSATRIGVAAPFAGGPITLDGVPLDESSRLGWEHASA